MSKDDTVLVYDSETKKAIRIPARELAPGYRPCHVVGQYEEIWARPGEMGKGKGPEWHPPFDARIKALAMESFDTFKPLGLIRCPSPDEWEAGFRHDLNAWREIFEWLRIARVFKTLTAGRDLNSEQLTDIFQVVFNYTFHPTDKAPFITNPRTLSKKRVKEIAEFVGSDAAFTLVNEEECGALIKFWEERYDAVLPTLPADLVPYLVQPVPPKGRPNAPAPDESAGEK
jgi:hypothetical protein